MLLSRAFAIFLKEVIQMRRDRLTLAMMVGIPIIQLILFGFAINNDPRRLPTALLLEDQGRFSRSIVSAMETSSYFEIVSAITSNAEADALLDRGEVAFVVTIPAGFSRALMRGERIVRPSDDDETKGPIGSAVPVAGRAPRPPREEPDAGGMEHLPRKQLARILLAVGRDIGMRQHPLGRDRMAGEDPL